jgi:hypothetical protein
MQRNTRKLTDEQQRIVVAELLAWESRDFEGIWQTLGPLLEHRTLGAGPFQAWIVEGDLMVSFGTNSWPSRLSWTVAARLVGMSTRPARLPFRKSLTPRKPPHRETWEERSQWYLQQKERAMGNGRRA